MNNDVNGRLARLRGSLQADEPGARGFERMARNPDCTRLRALTIAGIDSATAAVKVYGEPAREGQSPFALAIGNRFDRAMADNGAAELLELYRSAGRLTTAECKVAIIPDLAPIGSRREMRHVMALRQTITERLLEQKLKRDPKAPNIIVKPRVLVTLLGLDHGIEPDALVASDSDVFYRAVEIKSYPDRAGKTESADIHSACRQAAVGVIALRNAVCRMGMRRPADLVPAFGDLILRVPGALKPTLRPMPLKGEVDSLERAIHEAPSNLDELEELLPAGSALDDPTVLESIPNSYRSSCREYCALAQHCKQAAVASGDPAILGDLARETLAAAGSISRALDLLRGSGAPPRTSAERALAEQLREADNEFREAV
jgi:hypothetical protein